MYIKYKYVYIKFKYVQTFLHNTSEEIAPLLLSSPRLRADAAQMHLKEAALSAKESTLSHLIIRPGFFLNRLLLRSATTTAPTEVTDRKKSPCPKD